MGFSFKNTFRALGELVGSRTVPETPNLDGKSFPTPPAEKGKGDEAAEMLAAMNNDPVQKILKKGVETPLRSFLGGRMVCVNLAQNTEVFYVDSENFEAPWKLCSTSLPSTLDPKQHLESLEDWIQGLDPKVIEFLRLSTIHRGILIEHLSRIGNPAALGKALAEYGAFHDNMKHRAGGFNTTEADQFKLAIGPHRVRDKGPTPIRSIKTKVHQEQAAKEGKNGKLAAPPTLMVNLSFDTFYYVSAHSEKRENIAIDSMLTGNERERQKYVEKIWKLLDRFAPNDEKSPDEQDVVYQLLLDVANSQGALIVILPSEKELREDAMKGLALAYRLSKIQKRIRSVNFYVQETIK